MKKIFPSVLIIAWGITFFTCKAKVELHGNSDENIHKAVAVPHPTTGNEVKGTITFTKIDEGVLVSCKVSGLTPGNHGFHIHQWGDCSSTDGKSAGGHFNPESKSHGAPDAKNRHIGDLGNIEADESGIAHINFIDRMLTFEGPNSIIGRAVIIHEKSDDLTSQPTGAAGTRVACGVIGVAE